MPQISELSWTKMTLMMISMLIFTLTEKSFFSLSNKFSSYTNILNFKMIYLMV